MQDPSLFRLPALSTTPSSLQPVCCVVICIQTDHGLKWATRHTEFSLLTVWSVWGQRHTVLQAQQGSFWGRVEIHPAFCTHSSSHMHLRTGCTVSSTLLAFPPALPVRPFPAQPLRSDSQARAASHAAASTSSSGNLAAGHKRLAGNADASGSGSGNARLGKPPPATGSTQEETPGAGPPPKCA